MPSCLPANYREETAKEASDQTSMGIDHPIPGTITQLAKLERVGNA
jgi:hypothetical protein